MGDSLAVKNRKTAIVRDAIYIVASVVFGVVGFFVAYFGQFQADNKDDEKVCTKPQNHYERVARLEAMFDASSKSPEWCSVQEIRIREEVKRFAVVNQGSPIVKSIECRGNVLCRLVLDHVTDERGAANVESMNRGEVFEWDGGGESVSVASTIQLLFLVKRGKRFNGCDIVEDTTIDQ